MFCQSCGAKNVEGARFCNMCGERIATAGSPGGPVEGGEAPNAAAGAPASEAKGAQAHGPSLAGAPSPMGLSSTGVTLARIGVRSGKSVWAWLAVAAAALIGLGALGMWLVSGGSGEAKKVTVAGHAKPSDPFVIGTPLPKGADTPDVGFVAKGSAGGGGSNGAGAAHEPPGAGARRPKTTTSKHASAAARASAASGKTGKAKTTSKGGSGSSGSAGAAGSGAHTGSASAGGGSSAAAGTVPAGAPAERDIGLDLYGARVRYVVKRYYAARAQSCFDHATRNNPGVSGTVVVSLTIGGDGQVTAASIGRNTTGDGDLGACLAAQVRSWKLPPPPSAGLEMEMPFSR